MGTSYYCLGVLAKPIVADTGWPMTTVFLALHAVLAVATVGKGRITSLDTKAACAVRGVQLVPPMRRSEG